MKKTNNMSIGDQRALDLFLRIMHMTNTRLDSINASARFFDKAEIKEDDLEILRKKVVRLFNNQ